MGCLIDTSVLVAARDVGDMQEDWAVSVVTIGELEAGVMLAPDPEARARRLALLSSVLAEAPALPVDRQVGSRYGELRALAGRRPTNDLWIAATALAHDLTLITSDSQQASLPLVRACLV